MKRIIIVILIVTTVFIAGLIMFDPWRLDSPKHTLKPETIDFLVEHGQPSRLDDNAYLQIIALHLQSTEKSSKQTSYEDAKTLYLRFDKAVITGDEDPNVLIEQFNLFPQINRTEPEFCGFFKDECIEKLINNRKQFEAILQQHKNVLDNYRAIHQFNNFDPLYLDMSQEIRDALKRIHTLLAVEVFYLIEDNRLDLAVEYLGQALAILRKATQQSDALYGIQSMRFLNQHLPLIQRLKQTGNTNWQPITHWLQPLSLTEVTLQHYRDQQLIDITRRFLTMSRRQELTQQSLTQATPDLEITLDPNYCLNQMLPHHKSFSVKVDEKKQLIPLVKGLMLDYQNKKQVDLTLEVMTNPDPKCHAWIAMMPEHLSLEITIRAQISFDRVYQLIRLIIASQQTPLQQLMAQPQWIDPYTGKAPYIKDQTICYSDDINDQEPTCIDIF